MEQKLYVVYDSASETYTAPTVHRARGEAIRSFTDGVNSPDGVLSTHSADFTLFEIGEYNQATGDLTLYEAKHKVLNGIEVKENPPVPPKVQEITDTGIAKLGKQ